MKDFLNKNKVFIIGLLQFTITTLTETLGDPNGHYNTWIIVYSALLAILTYFGNNLRGQGASISLSLASSLMVIGGLHDQQVPITLQVIAIRIVMPLSLAILGIFFTSPPKDRAYEKSAPIVEAKAEAKVVSDARKSS